MIEPSSTDTVTYGQVKEVLRSVSDDYAHDGESGDLSAPAHEVLQAAWVRFRDLNR